MDIQFKKHSYLPFRGYPSSYQLLMGLGMLLLAIEPIGWLTNSWLEPAHDSKGGWVFLLCAGLFLWSIRSPISAAANQPHKKAILLLIVTAFTRGFGQVFAVNVLGAVALAIDVYAIGLLTRLSDRKNSLSPGWLAILFAFSLPLERILQRLIGFGLQHLSADGACTVLQSLFANVKCAGIRILLAGRDVLVDLPCSGVKSLMLLCILYAALMCVFRLTLPRSLMVGIVTLASALLANIIRIVCLSIFIAFPEKIGGINVMAQPWHDLIGLFCLTLAALPLALLSGRRQLHQAIIVGQPDNQAPVISNSKTKTLLALGFVSFAAVIVSLPRQPLDISDNRTALNLPVFLAGQFGQTVALNEQEQDYFTQFGGTALKVRYGDNSAMLIRSNSPLRHLHAPDECLRGLGFDVKYQGIQYQPLPTAIYITTAPDGLQWRVAVTFYSQQGQFTTNISEVVWRWLQDPHSTWYALQRITPVSTPDASVQEWDSALFAALDLTSTNHYPNPKENSNVKSH
ncbi:MAG: exosortase T [Methyloglobulus sp.]|nr:exosortase T [Methyloglobulus sp.]